LYNFRTGRSSRDRPSRCVGRYGRGARLRDDVRAPYPHETFPLLIETVRLPLRKPERHEEAFYVAELLKRMRRDEASAA